MGLTELIASVTGAGGGILLLVMTLVQIAPVKVNPWSWIATKLGRAINGEVIEKVDKLDKEIKDLRNVCDEREANSCRTRILRFNDEILHKIKHTKEHFEQVFADIKIYEEYCDNHPHYKNNIATHAIANINRVYQKCEEEGTFL